MNLAQALPLSRILNVSVLVTPSAIAGVSFNQACIIGPSAVIPTEGTNPRVRQYGSLDDMLAGGFTADMPEYKAAALYFGQYPAPTYVWIGRQDVATETPLEAITACREATLQWYACTFVGTATIADHLAVAAYIETCRPASMYFITWDDLVTEGGSPPAPLFDALMALGYDRTLSIYSTTQSGAFPNNAYAAAAALGVAMGRNTGLPRSYFDIMFKAVLLVEPEPLTEVQMTALVGVPDRTSTGVNANAIVQYQNGAIWTEPGIMASGRWFDELLFLDQLVYDIQKRAVDLLSTMPVVPLTDGGVLQMKNVIAAACDNAKAMGFIAPSGTWAGPNVPGSGVPALAAGSPMPNGYYLYAPPASQLTATQRARRVLPGITVALIEAESGHSLSVTVLVQQ